MRFVSVCLAAALACGCSGSMVPTEDVDDHANGVITMEADEIAASLDEGGVSAPIRIDDGFRRVGLLWDATQDGALELRTSVDGQAWSAWSAPTQVSVEEIARAGHLDVDTDDDAGYLQFRVPEGAPVPTFLVFEPLAEIPEPVQGEPLDDAEIASLQREVSTPIGSLTIHSRAEWGAKPPRCSGGSMTPNRATIHHTVTPTQDTMSPQARLRQIQSFHMNSRGWCDIGYNFLVSRDGRVWRGRGGRTIGAHVANANTGNVGISFMGTHTSTGPTSKQMCQTAKLLARLHQLYPALSLTRSDVKGHRQYGGTTCPGTALYNRIDDIVRKAKSGCSTP